MNALHTYDPASLRAYGMELLIAVGMEADKAAVVADVLVEGDLLGHTTHGLAQLSAYLDNLSRGVMKASGTYTVVSDYPAAATWDGEWLPGPWLTRLACAEAKRRAQIFGTGTVVIRRSHHIACLAAYLEPITAEGFVCIIQSSDPAVSAVAPYGGTTALLTPNPIAVGIPTRDDPILVDVSMSIGTVGLARRLIAADERAPFPWLLDGQGQPTDDPAVFDADPKGSLMLLGGTEAGYKGFGMVLMVEALTNGLGGHGRSDKPSNWGASVFVQVLDPKAFGGTEAFLGEMSYLADACTSSPSSDAANPVRMPGSAAMKRKRNAMVDGVALHPTILTSLKPWEDKLGVASPPPK